MTLVQRRARAGSAGALLVDALLAAALPPRWHSAEVLLVQALAQRLRSLSRQMLLSSKMTGECITCDRGLCDLVRHNRLLHDGQRASPVVPHRCHQGRRAPAQGPACFLHARGARRPCAARDLASWRPGETPVAPLGSNMRLGLPTRTMEAVRVSARCGATCFSSS